MGTSLLSRKLYSTERPIADKMDPEALMKPYLSRADHFYLVITKEMGLDHGQWVWALRSTTVDYDEPEH
jgi:hypothetical protein